MSFLTIYPSDPLVFIHASYHPSQILFYTKAMFDSRKVIYEKSLSKLFCICLSLKKLVNGKHFPVKGKFGLVSRKMFS
jgi:hypothetical protein